MEQNDELLWTYIGQQGGWFVLLMGLLMVIISIPMILIEVGHWIWYGAIRRVI